MYAEYRLLTWENSFEFLEKKIYFCKSFSGQKYHFKIYFWAFVYIPCVPTQKLTEMISLGLSPSHIHSILSHKFP